ncbi:hypothetical protein QR680_011460 [Steinernema hermaphroditum]|uniref:G-protein coupled receptors family 1 profile domain-containing protein n=1 Tax=Steinernema hermaphroditum TaxID=289476 RepID=A0AA39I058_9BILA|nr:hypothetical protein QR680_011460 [Steinernema hermaphroditum]
MFSFEVAAVLILTLSLLGVFGNVNILVATYRLKPRVRSNLLIGMLAFCDLICILFELQNAVRLLFRIDSYRRGCFWTISPYLVMIVCQSYLMTALAFDRLYALASPMKYQKGNIPLYLFLCLLPGLICGTFLLFYGALNLDNQQIPVCNPPLAFPPFVSLLWNKVTIASLCLTLVGYGSAFSVLVLKRSHIKVLSPTDPNCIILKAQQKVTKSLGIMTLAFVLSGCSSHVDIYVIRWFHFSENVEQIYISLQVIPAMLCYSQNYYVYFCCSKTYREVFLEQLRWLLKCENTKTRVYSLKNGQTA